MKKFIEEFKDFALKGNVIDLAVAVIIGGAFGKIVSSLVENVLMPMIAAIFSVQNFEAITFSLNGTPIEIGIFIQALVDFLIIALILFTVIKAFSKLKRKEDVEETVEEEKPSEDILLLQEIRDLLKNK
ncbi:MAG: large conductance mechanosensitive channel protein MscL [Clostridium sp.]|nr:large conductance mechanosensitive channel protein MscL [Clostridium sp.]